MSSFFNKINFGVKVIAFVIISLILSFIINFIFVKNQIEKDYLDAIVKRARSVALISENIRSSISMLWERKLIDSNRLLAETSRAMKNIKNDKERLKVSQSLEIYQTIPIVRSWAAIKKKAEELNYKFKVLSLNARNPRNQAKGKEARILRKMGKEKLMDYSEVDEESNSLRYIRMIRVEKGCLTCHGSKADYPEGGGRDILGFKMEKMTVGEARGGFQFLFSLDEMDSKINIFFTKTLILGTVIIAFIILFILKIVSKLAVQPIRNIKETMNKIAEGNLTINEKTDLEDDIGKTINSMNSMSGKLNLVVGEIREIATNVYSNSHELNKSSQSTAQGAAQQASAIEEISSSVVELSSQSKQVSSNIEEVKRRSEKLSLTASRGSENIEKLLNAIKDIGKSSHNITKIMKTIDEISFQTNILALNAAVEAARAGRHGRGFAVVAREVNSLSNRSSLAAKESEEIIEESLKKIEQGKSMADHTILTLQDIMKDIKEIASLAQEVSIASEDQVKGINQVDQGFHQINEVTQQNAGAAEETASTSEELSSYSEKLKKSVSFFITNKK